MKFLKPKRRPHPVTSFERYLHSQPVFNWFDRYDKSRKEFSAQVAAPAPANLTTK